jgi:hypothetical protein
VLEEARLIPFKPFTLAELLRHLEQHPWSHVDQICETPGWSWAAEFRMVDELGRLETLHIVKRRVGSGGPEWALLDADAETAIRACDGTLTWTNKRYACRVDLSLAGGRYVGRCPACGGAISCSTEQLGRHECAGCGSRLNVVPKPGSLIPGGSGG